MGRVSKAAMLRLFFFALGPLITVILGWSWVSITIASSMALVSSLLHVYYRNIYVPLPIFFLRVAAFTAIQLIIAAMFRHSPSSAGVVPVIDSSVAVPMAGKMALNFLHAAPIVTMSIVLPCANEGRFAWKTAESIAAVTPDEILHEIIVVDDGSSPPLISQFPPEIIESAKVKFVRHESHTGLINAKSAGADVATGDIIVFLDCHVKPAVKWAEPIIELIRSNYKRVVVPSITGLNPDTWEEERGNGGQAKCYLTWDSDFKWFDSDDDYVAVMSGGLLAMSREWWLMTGGYDRSMKGWGGENIDQSVRTWLCGGEIVQASTSYVGHMWRTRDKPETAARYTVPPGSVTMNRYKGAAVWMGPWAEKLEQFPNFKPFVLRKPDMSSIQSVKNRLQCRDFSFFIDKFYKVYHWAGLLPLSVFHLRDSISGQCLAKTGDDKLHLVQCSDSSAGQLWHKSNRNGNECCSGYRNWNSDQCIVGGWIGATGHTSVCSVGGGSNDQFVSINKAGQLALDKKPGACFGGKVVERTPIGIAKCLSSEGQLFNKLFEDTSLRVPGSDEEFRLEDAKRPGLCLAALGGNGGNLGRVEIHDCDEKSALQLFGIKHFQSEKRLAAVGLGIDDPLCFDVGGSGKIGLYPCYLDQQNSNQNVHLVAADAATIRIEFKDNNCVTLPQVLIQDSSLTGQPLTLTGCIIDGGVTKRGQVFERKNTATLNVFSLVTKDGKCFGPDKLNKLIVNPKETCEHHLFTQDPRDANKRLKHVPSGLCVDGNNGITPTLYTCYSEENSNQQFDLSQGNTIMLERTETCFDFEPATVSPANVIPCAVAEQQFKWEEYKPFVPLETKIYNEQKALEKQKV